MIIHKKKHTSDDKYYIKHIKGNKMDLNYKIQSLCFALPILVRLPLPPCLSRFDFLPVPLSPPAPWPVVSGAVPSSPGAVKLYGPSGRGAGPASEAPHPALAQGPGGRAGRAGGIPRQLPRAFQREPGGPLPGRHDDGDEVLHGEPQLGDRKWLQHRLNRTSKGLK